MHSKNKQKHFNFFLVFILLFNILTQATLPTVAFATEDTAPPTVVTTQSDTSSDTNKDNAENLAKDSQVSTNDSFELPIMHMNDTHANVENYAYMINNIRDFRATNENSILLHAGDVFSGTLYFNRYKGAADLALLNLMRVDAMVFGNHEFDLGNADGGHSALASFVSKAEFPFLGTNIDFSTDPNMKVLEKGDWNKENPDNGNIYNSIILNVDNQKVGVFGLTTEDTQNIASPLTIAFSNYIEAANTAVTKFKDAGVNKIIALTHIGYSSNPEFGNDRLLANNVAGIDVIVGGHSHTELADPVVVKNEESDGPTVIVQTGGNASKLGTLNVTFDANGVITDHSGKLLSVATDPAKGAVMLPEVKKEFEKYEAGVTELANTKIGAVAKKDLSNPRAPEEDPTANSVRSNETELGNLVTDAMLYKAKDEFPEVQIAFQNGGGIRAPIAAGDITMGDVFKVLPFGNNPVIVRITGQELKEVLEFAVRQAPNENGGFLHVAGMKFFYDSTREPYDRVVAMYVVENGDLTPIEMNKEYVATTNAFTAAGGDGFDMLAKIYADGRVSDFGRLDWEQFRDYMIDPNHLAGVVDPVIEGRIIDLKGEELEPTPEPSPTPTPVVEVEVKVPGTKATIKVSGEGLEGLTLQANEASEDVKNIPTILGSLFDLFNISLVDANGNEVQPSGPVKVSISYDSSRVPEKLFHFGENFEIEESIPFEIIDGEIVFTTDSFSYFGIQYAKATSGETDTPNETETPTESDTAGESDSDLPATGSSIIVPIASGLTFIIAGLGTELYRKKRYN